jgi:hypothetical protein
MSAMSTRTSLPATAFAQARRRDLRSPAGLTDRMRHEAIGVRRRLPETMNAGAKISTGFLKDGSLPVDE